MKIMLDMDNVLSDTAGSVLANASKRWGIGTGLTRDDVHTWKFEDSVPGLTWDHVCELFMDPQFWLALPPVNGAASGAWILERNHQIHIVTDRFWYHDIWRDTQWWLDHNGFHRDTLAFCKAAEKPVYCDDHGMDLAIEDSRDNAVIISEVCPVLLLDRAWNQGEVPANVTRVRTWDAIVCDMMDRQKVAV